MFSNRSISRRRGLHEPVFNDNIKRVVHDTWLEAVRREKQQVTTSIDNFALPKMSKTQSTSTLLAQRSGSNRRSSVKNAAAKETENGEKNSTKERPEDVKADNKWWITTIIDVFTRVLIAALLVKVELSPPFEREVHAEELWVYKNPRRPHIVEPRPLALAATVGPLLLFSFHYILTRDKRDFWAANWAWTLALCLNGLITSLLKITVGRLRPDFYYRCFPDGVMVLNENITLDSTALQFNCTGRPKDIIEGRKSFPSGHSSFAFLSFGFMAYYLFAKLHVFNPRGRGQSWRFCVAITPLLVAMLVAVSRTCDYWHHWQDVAVGSMIGLVIGFVIYRQYYPSIFARDCHRPLVRGASHRPGLYERIETELESSEDDSENQFLDKEQANKYR